MLGTITSRAAAEQFFVLLFQRYTTAVLTYVAPILNVDEATGEADSSNAQALDNAARWVGDKDTAVLLQQIADRFFEASGWPGGRSRESFLAGNGCNSRSPITEMFSREANIWTLQQFPAENFDVFRRSPIQVCKRDNAADVSFSLNIYVVMEIKKCFDINIGVAWQIHPKSPKGYRHTGRDLGSTHYRDDKRWETTSSTIRSTTWCRPME